MRGKTYSTFKSPLAAVSCAPDNRYSSSGTRIGGITSRRFLKYVVFNQHHAISVRVLISIAHTRSHPGLLVARPINLPPPSLYSRLTQHLESLPDAIFTFLSTFPTVFQTFCSTASTARACQKLSLLVVGLWALGTSSGARPLLFAAATELAALFCIPLEVSANKYVLWMASRAHIRKEDAPRGILARRNAS